MKKAGIIPAFLSAFFKRGDLKLKRLIALFLSVILLFSLSSCVLTGGLFSSHLSKAQIFRLVEKNEKVLLEDIANSDFKNSKKIRGIEDVSPGESTVDFYCGGSGFGPATSYYGFYYSQNGEPSCIWVGGELSAEGNGWGWREKNGDNRYYTEKITGYFFYYEVHF